MIWFYLIWVKSQKFQQKKIKKNNIILNNQMA